MQCTTATLHSEQLSFLLLLLGCQQSTKHRMKAKQPKMIDFSSCA